MTLTTSALGRAVLTAAGMRAAEARAIDAGTPAALLMERAGAAAAAAILAYDPPASAVVLCGPGNNGGDGYVVARHLAAAGVAVTVAADRPPRTDPARGAAAVWHGPLMALTDAPPAALLVDALYGTGLTRALSDDEAAGLARLGATARTRVALDLPSGVGTDDGTLFNDTPHFNLTIAFGALKPAHVLEPARSRCGRVVVADIGLGDLDTTIAVNPRPALIAPSADAHKYTRGHVVVLGGGVGRGGAARLAAHAALHIAGAVTLGVPGAAVIENAARLDAPMLRRVDDAAALAALVAAAKPRALVVGPGIGTDARARALIGAALASGVALVVDGDAFTVFADDPQGLIAHGPLVLTPHAGEFVRVFGNLPGSKIDRARVAAARVGAVVVLKGPDTVIAAPDGRARINGHAAPWLATAGSGDVLAGIIGGLRASGLDAFDAACAGVWLHGDLGVRGGPGLTADAMHTLIPTALADL